MKTRLYMPLFLAAALFSSCGYSTSTSTMTRIYHNRILDDTFTPAVWEQNRVGILPYGVDKRSTLPIPSNWVSDIISERITALGYPAHLNVIPPNAFIYLSKGKEAEGEFSAYTNMLATLSHEEFNTKLSNRAEILNDLGRKFRTRYLIIPLISYNLERIDSHKRPTFLAVAALLADAALYADEPATKYDLINKPVGIHDKSDDFQYRTHFTATTSFNMELAVWDCKLGRMVRTAHKELVMTYRYTDWHHNNPKQAGWKLAEKVISLTVSQTADFLRWEKSRLFDREDLIRQKRRDLSGQTSSATMQRLTTSPMARD